MEKKWSKFMEKKRIILSTTHPPLLTQAVFLCRILGQHSERILIFTCLALLQLLMEKRQLTNRVFNLSQFCHCQTLSESHWKTGRCSLFTPALLIVSNALVWHTHQDTVARHPPRSARTQHGIQKRCQKQKPRRQQSCWMWFQWQILK